MAQKYKHEIILTIFLLVIVFAFYYLYGFLLPFILGMVMVFAINPLISKIQKVVKNRNLANSIFLVLSSVIVILFLLFMTKFVNRDFNRLHQSFTIVATNNSDKLDNIGQKVRGYLGSIYDFDNLKNDLLLQTDSLKTRVLHDNSSELDTESIKASIEKVLAMFSSNDSENSPTKNSFSISFIIFSTLLYFVLILYQYDYFDSLRKKYFSSKIDTKFKILAEDFNQSFVKYFKLRTKIVLILSTIYLTAFIIMDMPGIILLTIIIIILSYIPYLQYLTLIPIMIGCLVLSIENDHSFLLYFGIIIGIFVLASIIEELILTPKIMEKNIGMNPVIIILTISIWEYLLGLQGVLIGVPITSLIIIYFKRFVLNSYQEVLQNKE